MVKKMMKVIYDVNVDGLCYTSIVHETKRQKDILDVLDCLFDNSMAKLLPYV